MKGRVHKLTRKENREMTEASYEAINGKSGVFSGTEICGCGGKVVYIPMKTNSSGVGGYCEKCKR